MAGKADPCPPRTPLVLDVPRQGPSGALDALRRALKTTRGAPEPRPAQVPLLP
ncbi:hypothetical protein [Deinococcus xianganensis]|uniref:Uncharacterized protein n=1 Tax=Deinococcus xianganensis TaxID=1507289 RepID=A0A6I4YKS3_9DEIO|nr:hypothetical protein [Deinococcus xianganensis]MXV19667.1 hypothetical protein [Deinococcus xianganensis]